MFKSKIITLITALSPLLTAGVFAETVTLKSGKKIEGKVLEKTDQYIKIELNGSPLYYELKYIQSIDNSKIPLAGAEETVIKDASFHLKEALRYGSESRFKEAQEEAKKGLLINPGDHNLQEVLKMLDAVNSGATKKEYAVNLFKGSEHLINAQYEPAKSMFEKALQVEPDNAELQYYLGICYYYLEQYPQAITNLEKAAGRNSDIEVYYYLGLCHYSLGHFSDAILYLEKVLKINPQDADALGVLGMSRFALGRYQQAKEELLESKRIFQSLGDSEKAAQITEFLEKELGI